MTLFTRIKWFMAVALVFCVILATNLIDKNNFERIRGTVVNIYEDRLVAKDLIFGMSKVLHEKELAIATANTAFFEGRNQKANEQINELVVRFETTEITSAEKRILERFKDDLAKLQQVERTIKPEEVEDLANFDRLLKVVKEDLDKLSEIQLQEGNRQVSIGKKAMDNVELFTQIEIYLLIFLALLIQFLILYRPKKAA